MATLGPMEPDFGTLAKWCGIYFFQFKGYSIRVQGPVASNDWHVGGRTPVPRGTHAALLSQSFSGVNQLVGIVMRKKDIYVYMYDMNIF